MLGQGMPGPLAWVAAIVLIVIGAAIGIFAVRRVPSIMSPDGRRAWSFAAICGGCGVFTVFAAVGVWLVSKNEFYTLCLALAAHAQVLIGMTALGWTLGRRMNVDASKDGFRLSDQEQQPGATATVTATVQTTPAATAAPAAQPSGSEAD